MTHSLSQVHCDAKKLGDQLKQQHLQLVTAESCTGGQLAQTITSVPGASAWFERGFVTYSRLSKQQVLGIDKTLFNQYGAVSKEVVLAMATGALNKSPASVSIAITGIAGPDGGTEQLPVGTIWTAWVSKNAFSKALCQHYSGDRLIIRYAAVEFALQTLLKLIK
ncbi:damage-inducible protein CinA [Candidatus Rickettsiella isopodorum]|jgi:nicotinamide-nucleotide amidase|uniref:Damage-inducible protein CinA n=1 Tax=Candidatus Rickettsiella isopodorum TaxID=1225476 RepID=A0A1J8PKE5_9COXI|nr:CinA family protein [Candidatus Rickettsiella isopodorum]OIZ95597.1 damage-inducible protein CinA [Candidatus Rickettsiella isopodorum]